MKKVKRRYRYTRVINWEEILWGIIPLFIILLLWNTPLIYIFKLFVILVHEYSHGLAAILTGGTIESISISMDQGGYAITRGGNELLIISAGYLGSLLFGIFILGFSKIKKLNKILLILLALIILGMTILYIQTTFAIIYSILFVILLWSLIFFGGNTIRYHFLRFLGILTMLYAVYDIKSDLFFNREINDAVLLENATGVPAIIWTLIWTGLAFIFLYYLFFTKIKKEEIY